MNTIVAEALSQFADILEKSSDFDKDVDELIRNTIKKHKRIIYNGNNYSDEWVKEAEKRGLFNLKTTPEALPHFISKKNIDVLTKHKVLTETEIHSRYEISMEEYVKEINIEALTLADMVHKDILPSSIEYSGEVASIANKKSHLQLKCDVEKDLANKLNDLIESLYTKLGKLENYIVEGKKITDISQSAMFYRDKIFACLEDMRVTIDELEKIVSKKYWKLPTYGDMLYSLS